MNELLAGPALSPCDFAEVRRRLVLDGCKWDPQVGDIEALAAFPLFLPEATWHSLARDAERLFAELIAAEAELVLRPELYRELGLPRALRRALLGSPTPSAGRIVRFDFHPTRDGWRISEANSDVPGGYTEGSFFPQLVAERFPGSRPAGNPGAAWADAIAAGAEGEIALLWAPGFLEDLQVVSYLARLLEQRGRRVHLARPENLTWRKGRASLAWSGPLGAIVRFYQAEWLRHLRGDWKFLLAGGLTPVANPGTAILTESKRLPLVWDRLGTKMEAWKRLLPETRDPRDVPWRRDDSWIVKPAFGNNGDDVAVSGTSSRWRARLFPGAWIAQRRFEPALVQTPSGPMQACLGVYVVEGRAAGIYGRLARKAIVDYEAIDVPVLIAPAVEAGPR